MLFPIPKPPVGRYCTVVTLLSQLAMSHTVTCWNLSVGKLTICIRPQECDSHNQSLHSDPGETKGMTAARKSACSVSGARCHGTYDADGLPAPDLHAGAAQDVLAAEGLVHVAQLQQHIACKVALLPPEPLHPCFDRWPPRAGVQQVCYTDVR